MAMTRILPILAIAGLLGAVWAWQSGILAGDPAPATQARDEAGNRPSQRGGQRPAAGGEARRFPAAKVVVSQAVEKMLAPAAEAPGTVISTRDSRIAAETTGKVTWVAEVGDIVEKDGVVAILDDTQARLTVRERKAELARLRARLAFLDDRYQRFSDLGDEIGESVTSLEQMRSERDEMRQQVNSARVALERAEFFLDRTKIRAPFNGNIAIRSVEVGEFANPGTQIVRLVDTKNLEVRAQTPAALVSALSPGDPVSIISGTETRIAKVRAIVPVGDEITRTMELRAALPPQSDLFVGAAVRVIVPSAKPRLAIAAPRDSLHIRTNEIMVYRVNGDQQAEKIPVELGLADGDLIEIIGDVRVGDNLVIRGGERLHDGQRVEIIPSAAEAA